MTPRNVGSAAALLLLGAAIGLLPLGGAALAGRDLAELIEFPPPLAIPINYPRWSWLACALVLFVPVAIAMSWWRHTPRANVSLSRGGERGKFPWWGWVAVAWTLLWWVLAWTRFAWFAPLQLYTFFPLWLGFIIAVNALAVRIRGSCLMQRAPAQWLGLFAASAVFWWMFEWLNRFVRNWHYLAVESFGPLAYAVHATLCFSTVLPAVAAVAECLGGCVRCQARWARGPAWPWLTRRTTGVALIAAAAAGLLLTGLRPQEAYPALWSAPLALLLGAGIWTRRQTVADEVATGDWRRLLTWACAALACGFFWEMWNIHSLAKWIYTVPYVDRAHVFEMPLLGYLGYLPFGLECLLVADRLLAIDLDRDSDRDFDRNRHHDCDHDHDRNRTRIPRRNRTPRP